MNKILVMTLSVGLGLYGVIIYANSKPKIAPNRPSVSTKITTKQWCSRVGKTIELIAQQRDYGTPMYLVMTNNKNAIMSSSMNASEKPQFSEFINRVTTWVYVNNRLMPIELGTWFYGACLGGPQSINAVLNSRARQ